MAASKGHLEVVMLLLENGAIYGLDKDEMTSLSGAATKGHVEVVGLLLENGATHDPNMHGRTSLYMAASCDVY